MGNAGPALAFQLVPESKQVKNRLHLDLAVEDRSEFVAKAIELGASQVQTTPSATASPGR